jgi:hypothetical protein
MCALACLCCLLALGCGAPAPRTANPRRPPPPLHEPAPAADRPADYTPAEAPVAAKRDDPLPPDLRTRKGGSDWPSFLGPTGDCISTERSIVTPWPKEGPRQLWQLRTGMGYAMSSISRGRLFLFARLRAFRSETAEHLWTFEYPSNYRDMYGFDGGPCCCPVADGPRSTSTAPRATAWVQAAQAAIRLTGRTQFTCRGRQ